MDINKPLKDWEISCLANRISPIDFDHIAMRFLGLPKIRLDQCRTDTRDNSVLYMTTSLILWRELQTDQNEARQILHRQLTKAANEGLVEKRKIQFLVTGEENDSCGVEIEPRGTICLKRLQRLWQSSQPFHNLFLFCLCHLFLGIGIVVVSALEFDSITLDRITTSFVNKGDLVVVEALYYLFAVLGSWLILLFIMGIRRCLWLCQPEDANGEFVTQRRLQMCYLMYYIMFAAVFLTHLIVTAYLFISMTFLVIDTSLLESLMQSVKTLADLSDVTAIKAWDELQRTMECCGIHSYKDWYKKSSHVPDSCCKVRSLHCGNNVAKNNIYQNGCLEDLKTHFNYQVVFQAKYWRIAHFVFVLLWLILLKSAVSNAISQWKDEIKRKQNVVGEDEDNQAENIEDVDNEQVEEFDDVGNERELLINDEARDEMVDVVVHQQEEEIEHEAQNSDDDSLLDLL